MASLWNLNFTLENEGLVEKKCYMYIRFYIPTWERGRGRKVGWVGREGG